MPDEQMLIEHFEPIREILENAVKDYKLLNIQASCQEKGVDGTCNYKDKVITIKDGMSYAKTLLTLVHEIAHANCRRKS